MFEFANPWALALLVIPLLIAWWRYGWVRGRERTFRFSDLGTLSRVNSSYAGALSRIPFYLRLVVLALVIVALARPRSGSSVEETSSEGVDIILTVDLSTSMLAQDLKRGSSRLEVVKQVVDEFISRRRHDRIGLVAFAANAVTRCPPTLDYRILRSQLENLDTGQIEDGTAIGVALASSVNRLRDSEAKSRIIVLLTDGMNNRGAVDPLTAARVAAAEGVKVYTIGAGSMGTAPMPVRDAFGRVRMVDQKVEIDENVLKQIAETTGGNYYRATRAAELEQIYEKIDSLEKTRVEVREYRRYKELYAWFLLPALVLFMLELGLAATRLRTIPGE